MSNNFTGIAVLPFRGVTARYPVKLAQGTMPIPGTVPPSVVPVQVNWLTYWQQAGQPSNVGVYVNLQASSVQASILDRIASIKIDNTGSPSPVYVVFGDTGDVISCAPYTAVTFPCLTNLLNAVVYIQGLQVGFIPTTKFFFYNSLLPPAVDTEINNAVALWRASPAITLGNTIQNRTYDTPALGDQIINVSAALNALGNTIVLPAVVSGFYYITSCFITLVNPGNPTAQGSNIRIADLSTGLNYWFLPIVIPVSGYTPLPVNVIYQGSGFNLKLDATHGLTYVNPLLSTSGVVSITMTYTYQP